MQSLMGEKGLTHTDTGGTDADRLGKRRSGNWLGDLTTQRSSAKDRLGLGSKKHAEGQREACWRTAAEELEGRWDPEQLRSRWAKQQQRSCGVGRSQL